MDKITTQGRFSDATIAIARDVFPEPELPATPMMLAFPHGGSYSDLRPAEDMVVPILAESKYYLILLSS
jgi:hypothetical protein